VVTVYVDNRVGVAYNISCDKEIAQSILGRGGVGSIFIYFVAAGVYDDLGNEA